MASTRIAPYSVRTADALAVRSRDVMSLNRSDSYVQIWQMNSYGVSPFRADHSERQEVKDRCKFGSSEPIQTATGRDRIEADSNHPPWLSGGSLRAPTGLRARPELLGQLSPGA